MIEDATLINDINMLFNYTFQSGVVTITTSANVTADFNISYYSYDINDQFDKYVFITETQSYERIGT